MTSPAIVRAALWHTVANPWKDSDALVCLDDGAVLVEEGRIAACGTWDDVRAVAPHATVLDRRDGFLLPGFVDTHVHFPQARILGRTGLSLLDWLQRVALPEEARMADVVVARDLARCFLRALAAHGSTTASVFGAHFLPATEALFEAATESGLRIATGLVVSDRGLRPDLLVPPDRAWQESRALIERFHGSGHLLYTVTPRFALSASEAMLEVCQALLDEFPAIRCQTHVNEHPDEVARVAALFPWASDYLAVYERYGLAGRRAILAHDVHVTSHELQRMAASGVSVAHCPSSNALLGSGIFPMDRHVRAGVHVALGTDVGAGAGFSIPRESLYATMQQRVAADPVVLEPSHRLYLATLAGADALGLAHETGSLEPGKSADFVYLRADPDTPLALALDSAASSIDRLGALLALAGPDTIREVRVAGRVVFPAA